MWYTTYMSVFKSNDFWKRREEIENMPDYPLADSLSTPKDDKDNKTVDTSLLVNNSYFGGAGYLNKFNSPEKAIEKAKQICEWFKGIGIDNTSIHVGYNEKGYGWLGGIAMVSMLQSGEVKVEYYVYP